MGPLLQTILAVGVLGAIEAGLEAGVELPWAVALLVPAPYFVAHALRRAGVAGRFRLERKLARVLALSPLLVHGLALALCGWRLSVSRWTGGEVSFYGWPGPALLLVFAPFALAMLASIDARARLRPAGSELRRGLRALGLRMFASIAAPLTAFTLGSALVGRSERLRVSIEEVSVWGAGYSLALLLVMLALLPPFLRLVFENEPLPAGPLRRLLEAVAERARFRCKELLVWRTGSLVPNAAILGLWPGQRLVVFSDALLAQLGPRELAAVYAHEIGHARRHHVPIFLACTGAFFLGADLVSRAIDPEGGARALAAVALALALWFLGFVQLSRRFELEADLHAIEVLGEGESLARALEAVGGDLRDVASLRHFSPAKRAAFLRRAELDPGFARAFRLRLRAVSVLVLLAFLAVAALQVRALVRDWPAEQSVAEQRLGEGERARARVAALREEGRVRDLEQLVRRCGYEVAYELERDRPEAALQWLELAAAAGQVDAEQAARALRLLMDGRLEAARAALERTHPELRRRLVAWAEGASAGAAQ